VDENGDPRSGVEAGSVWKAYFEKLLNGGESTVTIAIGLEEMGKRPLIGVMTCQIALTVKFPGMRLSGHSRRLRVEDPLGVTVSQ
jgi:hypothetical protein